MNDANAQVKQQKREARQLWDLARERLAAGNYRAVRELDEKIVAMSADEDPGPKAVKELENLRVDRWVLYVGLGAVAVYATAWLYALSG